MPQAVLRWMIGVLLLSTIGCAAIRSETARTDSIHGQLDGYTIAQPAGVVFANAREVLFSHGYSMRRADSLSGISMETESRVETVNGDKCRVRYLVQAVAVTPVSSAVRIQRYWSTIERSREQAGTAQSERDYDLELEVIRRVDPLGASRIEGNADRAARAAYDH